MRLTRSLQLEDIKTQVVSKSKVSSSLNNANPGILVLGYLGLWKKSANILFLGQLDHQFKKDSNLTLHRP